MSDTTTDLPRDYTLEEVADSIRMSERWVRDRIKAGEAGTGPVIPHERRGHKIMFTAEQAENLRTAFTATPTPELESITTGRKKTRR